ncbi:hypothetical protein [Ancylomarina sp. 16SWW S1-10-2]|uniref:hypothetical protein n=1 Tax=Ancylomarina sp. 16SWW S1-10-2 TaxID=2499681 RepID=UPI0012ADE821|nr:hypothetical protein [Ancylomarina sp. 16SWW S1-10-2]MRT91675.1 hypothetical protein [Ancylomarina sp. 16SWW S1-10-2]
MSVRFQIEEVENNLSRQNFLELPMELYKGEPNWVCPLDSEIEAIFDSEKNKMFRHGACCRWILKNSEGHVIGRVAAFVDNKTKDLSEQSTGGMGFFECIDDKEAAFILFDRCVDWLKGQGVEAMDGPINFGERHQWWGLLVDGFHRPLYGMPYSLPYYRNLFETYGFKTYFKQYTYKTLFSTDSLSEIITWKAKRVLANPDYSIVHFRKNNRTNFIKDFVHIYNEAWVSTIPGVDSMTENHATETFNTMESVLDERLLWFAYHKNEPIGFFIMTPDLNEILSNSKGKFGLLEKIKFLQYKYLKKNKNAMGLIFGVIPAFQSKGIDAAMIYQFSKEGFNSKFPFKTLEMNWIGDFNPRMMHMMEHIGASIYKTHITYRKLFDENKEFKRSPIVQ